MGSTGKTPFNYFGFFASAFTLILGMTACEQPTTFLPGNTDRFTAHNEDYYSQANRVLQADYVFVLDYSSSMSSGDRLQSTKITGLINSMSDFTEYLSNENIDYNIGFIRGNTHANSTSTIATNFVSSLITKDTTAAGLNSILADVGQPLNQNTNYLLEAALRTMNAQSKKFLRNSAQLVYVFVSDSDDRSHLISGSKTPNYYASELRKFKSNAEYVSARSFTAGVASSCATEEYDSAGTRIARTAQSLDSEYFAPQCVYTPMADSLFDLARNVTKTTKRFTLRGTPNPDSIQIFVGFNGNEYEQASSGNWTYQSKNNEVIFQNGKEPEAGSQLRIVYQMLYKLSRKPQKNSITVTINGKSISESQANGWSYIESENRIEFNGSAAPAQNDDVRISYIAI